MGILYGDNTILLNIESILFSQQLWELSFLIIPLYK